MMPFHSSESRYSTTSLPNFTSINVFNRTFSIQTMSYADRYEGYSNFHHCQNGVTESKKCLLRSKGTFKNVKKIKMLKTMFWGFYYGGKY